VVDSNNKKANQNQASEIRDVSLSALTFPNVIALIIIIGYIGFLAYMMLKITSEIADIAWTRATYILTGYEAVAFAATGYIFGKEVHRQQAENADERAEKAQGETKEAIAKGLKLSEAIKARASRQPAKDMQPKAPGVVTQQGDLEYLADLARELFP
jgi:hypothetical protein